METFITFFVTLITLVLIHELGHFWVAKKVGIFVEEFGLGLPPKAWGKKVGETLYTLNWLPIGGFVRLYGEDAEEAKEYRVDGKKIPKERAFYAKSPLARAAVVVAGVIMNFILAVVVFSLAYSFTGIPEVVDKVQVLEVAENSPAAEAGLEPLDVLTEIGAEEGSMVELSSLDDFTNFVDEHRGEEIFVQFERDGSQQLTSFVPRENPPANEGAVGVMISNAIESRFYPWYEMPFRGAKEGLKEAVAWSVMLAKALGTMFTDLLGGVVPKDVGGPVAIYQATGQVVDYGFWAKMRFMGILSVNLAIVNILPLPALDGGRLWFIIYEAVSGKKVPLKFERYVHTTGMVFLLGLILLVTIGDVARLFNFNLGALLGFS